MLNLGRSNGTVADLAVASAGLAVASADVAIASADPVDCIVSAGRICSS